jgi:hypothetical protein
MVSDSGESTVKIHPLVVLGFGLALMAFGHTPAPKRLEGLDKQRARARALFNVMPDCTLSVRGMPPGGVSAVQLVTKFVPMDQEYFYPMIGRAYLDGISDSDDIADYILKDLFPECDPPFTPDITGAMYLHVINLKLQGLGFAPSTSEGGIEAFRDYWNRFIAWLERHDPAVIAARPTVYRRFELEDDRFLGDGGPTLKTARASPSRSAVKRTRSRRFGTWSRRPSG